MDERLDATEWAVANFGGNDFGDGRLAKRCVSIGQPMATHPERFVAGAYRFLHNPQTDYKSVTKTHTEKTRRKISERAREARQAGTQKPYILMLGDSSDIIFAYKRHIKKAGPIGEHNAGQGFGPYP